MILQINRAQLQEHLLGVLSTHSHRMLSPHPICAGHRSIPLKKTRHQMLFLNHGGLSMLLACYTLMAPILYPSPAVTSLQTYSLEMPVTVHQHTWKLFAPCCCRSFCQQMPSADPLAGARWSLHLKNIHEHLDKQPNRSPILKT